MVSSMSALILVYMCSAHEGWATSLHKCQNDECEEPKNSALPCLDQGSNPQTVVAFTGSLLVLQRELNQ